MAFDNIVSQEADEYTVTISTELNGRTVTQTVEKFPMGSQEDEDEEKDIETGKGVEGDPSAPLEEKTNGKDELRAKKSKSTK